MKYEDYDGSIIICYDTYNFGQPIDNSITTNKSLSISSRKKWDIGTPSYVKFVEWQDTEYDCPDCGGIMQKHMGVVCTSDPPMCEYKCKDCGSVHYRFC